MELKVCVKDIVNININDVHHILNNKLVVCITGQYFISSVTALALTEPS